MSNVTPSIEVLNSILGKEFLTWLWFCSETNFISFKTLNDNQPFTISMEQKIVVQGGEGESLETASVSGTYASLREALFGLQAGKKVIRALIIFEKLDLSWKVLLRAEDFSLAGFTTPKVSLEDDEPDANFLEKMYLIETGLACLDTCYTTFLKRRLSSKWEEETKSITQWILKNRNIDI